MTILETLIKLRDDLKLWTTNNLQALDNKVSYGNIFDNQSDVFEIADTKGNVIARIDADGIHTTNIFADRIFYNSDIFEITDTKGNVIARIDSDGIHTTNIDVNSISATDIQTNSISVNEIYTSGKIDDISKSISVADPEGNVIVQVDDTGVKSIDFYVGDVSLKDKIHMWDAKSGFSGDYYDLYNKPTISEYSLDEFTITDFDGNIIGRFDKNGLQTTSISSSKILLNDNNLLNQIVDLYNRMDSISYDSIKDAPPISNVQEKKLKVIDDYGNIICLIDADGVTTTKINVDELILSNTSMDAEFSDFNIRLNTFETQINNFSDSVNASIASHESAVDTKISNFESKITEFENSITKVTYSTTDLVAGSSALPTGELYIVYE